MECMWQRDYPTQVPPTPGRSSSDAPDQDTGRTLVPPPRVSPMVVIPIRPAGVQLGGCEPWRSGLTVPFPSPPSWGRFCTRLGDEGTGELHLQPGPGVGAASTPQLASGFRLSWLRTPAVLQQIYRIIIPECLPRAGDGAWQRQASVSSQ